MTIAHDMRDFDDEEVGRFVVVSTRRNCYELTFFDKARQSDFVGTMRIPMEPGALQMIGAEVSAWLLMGVVVWA